MTDNINQISKNIDHVHQQTTASLAHLTDDDVVKIWDLVSAYIESFMKQSKGVIIPGFGTFSFIQKRIDVGNSKHLLVQRPVFVLSEKVLQTHGLKSNRYPVNGSVPVHPLNYFHIQTQSTNYTRDQIEQCVKHVLQVFHRSIAAQRNVEFTFSRIGKLQIRESKVKMRFFKDFVQSVDENGGKQLIETMCNRPQTCDSVISEREAVRPTSSSNVVLPRLNSRIGNLSMQSIEEETSNDDEQQNQIETEMRKNYLSDVETVSSNPSFSKTDEFKLPPLLETAEESMPHLVKTTAQPGESIIPIASIFSSVDLIQSAPLLLPRKTATAEPSMRRSTSVLSHEHSNPNPAGNHSTLGFTRPVVERVASSLNLHSQRATPSLEKPQTSCGHYGPGQELCHLCSQRAKRNIPVFLHDEKRIRDETEDKLLEEYRHNRELQEQKQLELKIKAAREEKQRIAAFNQGIAESKRTQKAQRPQTTDIPRSIIFRKRAKTPPNSIRQQDFAKQLESQIKAKKDEEITEKKDREFLERVEQIQLAEALVKERESFFRNKRLRQDALKNALDEQIRSKPSSTETAEMETTYFGQNDTTTEQLQQRRRQAIELFRQQKEIIEQRQRQLLLRQMRDQEYETDVLKSIKDDLLTDRRERNQRALRIRKNLETDWTQAAQEKKQRDQEERQYLAAPQGLLLHEQCDGYKRCTQCQRNLENRGQAHFWKDTRFIPGTHIIV